MNKSVLRTMIILCWVFLSLYAILKLVPQLASKFVIVVNNEKIVKVGQFIDERVWLQQMVHFVFALLTYHLYLCACCKVWHLSFKQYIISLAFILPNQVLTFFYPQIGSNIAFVIMFCLPCAFKADYKTVAIIFATHILGQLGISFIRSAELYMMNMNTISQIIMCIDQYVWLLLYYLYSNLYKENIMGTISPPLWGKMSKEIKEEKARIEEKLAVCKDEKKCKKYEAQIVELDKMLDDTSDEK